MDGIEVVCFDLDSTLCVRTQDDREIHEGIFDRAGVEPFFEPGDVHAVDVRTLPTADSERNHWENVYRAVGEHIDADPDPALFADLAEATVEILDPTAVSFCDGAREALEYAADRYEVGLLTNGTRETQRVKLDELGIADAFDAAVFCGPGTGIASKPDPEPFRQLLDELGVRPDAAVYVGNHLHGDVGGANNAGMRSIWVPRGDPPDDPDPAPTRRLESMKELPTVL